MTRIPVPDLDEIPTASKELLEWIMQTQPTGKVLNMQAQLAVAPAALAGYVALRRATEEHGTLDPKTRTAVLAMSGAALGVPYVERLTARIASSAGWQPDEIVRFTEGLGSGDEKLDSLLGVMGDAAKNLGSSTTPPGNERRTTGGHPSSSRSHSRTSRSLLHGLFHQLRGH